MEATTQAFDRWWLDEDVLRGRHAHQSLELSEQAEGCVHPYIEHLEYIAASAAQLSLKLPSMDERLQVRLRVADYLEQTVQPIAGPSIAKLVERLRTARSTFTGAFRPSDGKRFMRWDSKAGLPLLCPDDAREEAKRLQKRLMPEIERQLALGRTMHYAVFTVRNSPTGDLHKAMRALQRRFNSLMRSCKRKNRPFPIVGAVSIMECPMGWRGDWHPHLNVLLVCDGFLDYGKLRQRWHYNVELRRQNGNAETIARSLREIIKYSVKAVPEKSYEKATHATGRRTSEAESRNGRADDCRRSGQPNAGGDEDVQAGDRRNQAEGAEERYARIPPALINWPPGCFLEYWAAHRKFRRTRTYGCLYGLAKPEREDTSNLVHYVAGRASGGRYVVRFPLLESIPGDKSTTPDPVERWQKWLRPPPGAGWLIANGARIVHEFTEPTQ